MLLVQSYKDLIGLLSYSINSNDLDTLCKFLCINNINYSNYIDFCNYFNEKIKGEKFSLKDFDERIKIEQDFFLDYNTEKTMLIFSNSVKKFVKDKYNKDNTIPTYHFFILALFSKLFDRILKKNKNKNNISKDDFDFLKDFNRFYKKYFLFI